MFKKNKIFTSLYLFLFLFTSSSFSKEVGFKLDLGLDYVYSNSDNGYYSSQLEASKHLPRIGLYLFKDKYEVGFGISNFTNKTDSNIINNNNNLELQRVKEKNYYIFNNYKVLNDSYLGYSLNYNTSCRNDNCINYYSSNVELKQYFYNKNLSIGLSIKPNWMNFTNENIGSTITLKFSFNPTIY